MQIDSCLTPIPTRRLTPWTACIKINILIKKISYSNFGTKEKPYSEFRSRRINFTQEIGKIR